jgi:lysophospholipase L1-like esterase
MKNAVRMMALAAVCLMAIPVSHAEEAANKPAHELTLKTTGKWQNLTVVTDTSAAARLKAHPVLKVDITVPAESDVTWFQAKLAVHAEGMQRAESPKWLLNRAPGTTGIDKVTLTWDTTEVVAKMPDNPSWFKIEVVTQGDHARTVYVDNVRYENSSGEAVAEKAKPAAPAAATPAPLATPYPDKEADFPGKGPARKFPFMQGERDAFSKRREKDQGAIVFVGDSNTGGWKKLATDFPGLKVANRGVGGDTSRNVLFRFKEDVLSVNPKAIVLMIGGNDLTAYGKPADMLSNVTDILALADKEKPGIPVVLCTIPPNANPKAPFKVEDRTAMNEGLRKIAAERKNTYSCDLFVAMANDDASPKPEYFAADKVHMNDAGHSKWAELLKPVFAQAKMQD